MARPHQNPHIREYPPGMVNSGANGSLGTVLVALLGVGIADRSGLISAAMRGTMLSAPPRLVTAAVVFCGVMSNTAAELGYVVLIPLAAVIFHALGRHPLAGLAAAFAGVSGGYSANLLLGTVDPLLSGITQEAARLVDPDYTVGPEANWYFMFASTFLITLLGWFVTEKIIEPRLGPYNPEDATNPGELTTEMTGPLLLVGFIIVCTIINLMIASASAQWAITAPIFVPMLMLSGYAPEAIQAAYRIGDSSTNIITPMMSYFGLIMAVVLRYNRHAGVGTLMALMVPYSALFITAWSAFFYLWVFVLGLPVGPGAATYYTLGQ